MKHKKPNPLLYLIWPAVLLLILLLNLTCSGLRTGHTVIYERKPEPYIIVKNDSIWVDTGKHLVGFPYSGFTVKTKEK